MNNINTATAIPKLKAILEEDVSTLSKMIGNMSPKTDIYKLTDSLINAKKHISSQLPSAHLDMGMSPNPPKSNQPPTHSRVHKNQIKDSYLLPKIFLGIEIDQSEFVKSILKQPGTPEGVKNILDNTLSTYQQIISQLNRANKTNQINPIVL